MQPYIFLDLDDTLFQTLRKCTEEDHPRLQLRATLPDGTPNSFATHKQQWLWQWLAKDFKMVAVTARDFHAFERVDLPFQEEVVLNHGAVILDRQRNVDAVWMVKMQRALPAYHEKLLAVWEAVKAHCAADPGFRLRLVNDFDMTWYGVIKHRLGTEAVLLPILQLIETHEHLMDGSLYWHLNGNNLAILPKIINKQDAVDYLIKNYKQQYPDILTIAAGDSKSDAAFMGLCDYAFIPTNTQLFKALAASVA
ncbi:conserved hypothetical protein [Crenothrix polyspora]|uniref:Sucrose phosphatase-like domain-containing protein n=1 Tax=Crenothrix polyspora TaxID=360316 RepID=A0A1R4H4A1_9GAMM|nr:HAD family hydrolase [Crenothrix polyspora]SJM91098.1 conserved hypothetical protein [Crenothrix polyspora]